MSITAQCQKILDQLKDAPVTVVAATKYADIAQLEEAYQAGIRHFGENRVQDFLQKSANLPQYISDEVTWHFIGHLQTNKVNKIVGQVALIHAVDSMHLATAISQRAVHLSTIQSVLLQVNISGEESKHGFTSEEIHKSIQHLLDLPGLSIKGLMTMAPHTSDPGVVIPVFEGLKTLRDDLKAAYSIPLPELSMGMSHDYVHAMKSGATIIRLGNILFR